jgi:hypothetical protein
VTQAPVRPTSVRTRRDAIALPPETPTRQPVPWRPVVLLCLRTAALGVLAVEAVVLILWATEQGSTAGPVGALKTGLDVWLAAHRTGIAISGGHLGATPYGLTLLPGFLLWRGGRQLVRHHAVTEPGALARSVAAIAAIYGVIHLALAFVAAQPGAHPVPAQALLGSASVAAIAAGCGAFRASKNRPSLPGRLSAVLRTATASVVVILAAASLLTAVSVVLHRHAVVASGHAVAPSASGSVGLALLDLLAVPLVIVWSASFLLGPGFGVGVGTNVGLGSANYAGLPAVPVLAALPAPGTFSWAALLLLAVPVGAGVAAGIRLSRGTRRPYEVTVRALQTAIAAGVAFAVLAWLADGPIGPGRLSVAGPSPWKVGVAAFVEIGAGALIVTVVNAIRWSEGRKSR